MSTIEEYKERIDLFLNKQGLTIESKYFLLKSLLEDYWEEIQAENTDEDDDFEDFDSENEVYNEEEEKYIEEDVEIPHKKIEDRVEEDLEEELKPQDHKKGIRTLLKKTKVKTKSRPKKPSTHI